MKRIKLSVAQEKKLMAYVNTTAQIAESERELIAAQEKVRELKEKNSNTILRWGDAKTAFTNAMKGTMPSDGGLVLSVKDKTFYVHHDGDSLALEEVAGAN